MFNSLIFIHTDLLQAAGTPVLRPLSHVLALCKLININGLIGLLLLHSIVKVVDHRCSIEVFVEHVRRTRVVVLQILLRLVLLRLFRLDDGMHAILAQRNVLTAEHRVEI